ncbi:MAG: YceI family protein [Gordonia sp. (in: high G+C Gram-positive bacteria)]
MITYTHADGDLLIHTGVAGPAARTGHRLTIAVDWCADVSGDDDAPTAVHVVVPTESLQVRSGTGGLTPLSAPERAVARANALKSLQVTRFPEITFHAPTVVATADGYRLPGSLTICGRSREVTVDLQVGDGGRITAEFGVRQTDFGIKPYSLAMGTLKVADQVRLTVDVAAKGP